MEVPFYDVLGLETMLMFSLNCSCLIIEIEHIIWITSKINFFVVYDT